MVVGVFLDTVARRKAAAPGGGVGAAGADRGLARREAAVTKTEPGESGEPNGSRKPVGPREPSGPRE